MVGGVDPHEVPLLQFTCTHHESSHSQMPLSQGGEVTDVCASERLFWLSDSGKPVATVTYFWTLPEFLHKNKLSRGPGSVKGAAETTSQTKRGQVSLCLKAQWGGVGPLSLGGMSTGVGVRRHVR